MNYLIQFKSKSSTFLFTVQLCCEIVNMIEREIFSCVETYDDSVDHNYKANVSLFSDVAPIKVICVVCGGAGINIS